MPSPVRLAVFDSDDDTETCDAAGRPGSPITVSAASAACRWFLAGLCVVAMSVSGYLAWTAFQASEVFGCTGDVFDCGHVLSSAWSKWFMVPVSVPAFALYSSLLATLFFVSPSTPDPLRRMAWQGLTIGGIAAALAAVWFIGLQIFVIEHLCLYCLVAHSCSLMLAATVLWNQPLERQSIARSATVAMLATSVLVVGQLLTPAPQTFVVEEFPSSPDASEIVDMADGSDLFAAPGENLFAAPGQDVFAAPVADVFAAPGEASAEWAGSDTESEQLSENGSSPSDAPPTNDSHVPETEVTGDEPSANPLPEAAKVVSSVLTIFPAATLSSARLLFSTGQQTEPEEQQGKQDDVQKAIGETPAGAEQSGDQQSAVAAANAEPEPRIVTVAGDKFRLNAAHWPMIGKPTARYIMVEMFDYTCPHCRNTHKTIKAACQKYGDDLAVITLAVPLNPSCNNAITNSGSHNADSCELARLAIAVWRVKPEAYAGFHSWLFDAGRNRTSREARQQAEQLVGKAALDKELASKTPAAYIARHVELYKKVGSGAVPKMLFPTRIMTGEVNSVTALSGYIESSR